MLLFEKHKIQMGFIFKQLNREGGSHLKEEISAST